MFAESDEMAFGVMAAARALGLRVPEDLSVVGIDDHDISESMGLTTVAQPVRTLGELAALQLAGLIGNHSEAQPAQRVVVPTLLVVRDLHSAAGGAPRPPGQEETAERRSLTGPPGVGRVTMPLPNRYHLHGCCTAVVIASAPSGAQCCT